MSDTTGLAAEIDRLFELPAEEAAAGRDAVEEAVRMLDAGELRVAEPMLDVRLFRIPAFGTSALVLTLVFFALLAYALWDGFGKDKIPADLTPTDTGALSDAVFGGYLIPFEVVSLLLLAALVGAIVIARRD